MKTTKYKSPNVAQGLKYSTTYGITLILSKMLRGLVIPKILEPGAYGLFGSIGLFTRYLNFSDLGAVAHFTKEIPRLHFSNDLKAQQSLVNQTFSVLALGLAASSFTLLVLSFYYKGDNADFYKIALVLLIPIFVLGKIREFHMCYLYGIGMYRINTGISIFANYATLISVVPGVLLYGAIGGVVATLISEIFLIIIVLRTVNLPLQWELSRPLFHGVRLYLKQFLVQVTETLSVTIDQALLLLIFGPVSFGIYLLGLTFAWIFEAISEVFNTAFYPKIMQASLVNQSSAINTMQQAIFGYAMSSLLLLPGVMVSLDWLIINYFTKFTLGLDIFSLMLFLGLNRGCLALFKKGYLATNKERVYIYNSLLIVAINSLSVTVAWVSGYSFNEIVLVLVCANLTSFFVFYRGLVDKKQNHFMLNQTMVVSGFFLAVLYQYKRAVMYQFMNIDTVLIVFVAAYASLFLLLWKNKTFMKRLVG